MSTFVAYVDESGDEGFRFDAGSSRWFVVSAVVLRKQNELQEVKLVDHVRDAINRQRQNGLIPPKKPLHFRDLKHDARRFYASLIAQADLRTISVLVHKPDLASPERFRNDRLYYAATELLLERIAWYCRDGLRAGDEGDGGVEIVFSNRNDTDLEALRRYVERLVRRAEEENFAGEPFPIRTDRISAFSPGRRMGLQIADAVASGTFMALEPNAFGMTDESYARTIERRLYRRAGEVWGHGLKLMPRESEERRRSGELELPFRKVADPEP